VNATAQKRWEILAFVFLISVVTYLDRVNISIAGDPILHEYGLSRLALGTIFSAFVLGYGLFQVPGGWLGDKFGHKKILVIAIVWWSLSTCLTAWAGNSFLVGMFGLVPAFWIVRFLIGIGEAATYPCSLGLITHWFPERERALASGVMLAGVGFGSAVTPPFIALIMLRWGWRSAFFASSAIGVVLALAFLLRVIETPREDQSVDEPYSSSGENVSVYAEESISRGKILADRDVWLLTISDFLHAYIAYIYFFWFYLYLVDVRGFSALRSSYFTILPFVAMGLSSPLGGWISDRLITIVGRIRARQLVAISGLVPSALLILAGASARNAFLAVLCLALAAGFLYLSLSCYWATASEMYPRRSATVSAIMNTGANLGGALSPTLTAWLAARYGWIPALRFAAVLGMLAAALWIFIGGQQKTMRLEVYGQPASDSPNYGWEGTGKKQP
jgi:ACS family glucarate transporter-like MFS transporter